MCVSFFVKNTVFLKFKLEILGNGKIIKTQPGNFNQTINL